MFCLKLFEYNLKEWNVITAECTSYPDIMFRLRPQRAAVAKNRWMCKFNIHGSVHLKNIPIYIKQDAALHSLLYLEINLHVLGGTSTHHQERIQLYLQHLVFVTPLLPLAAGSSNGVTNTRCCSRVVCAPDDGWRYHPKPVEQFPDKINCVHLHLIGYILEYIYNAQTHKR